jgi:hypothetical protein
MSHLSFPQPWFGLFVKMLRALFPGLAVGCGISSETFFYNYQINKLVLLKTNSQKMLALTKKMEKYDRSTKITDKLAHKSRGYSLELIKELVRKRKRFSNSFMSFKAFMDSFSFSSYARFIKGVLLYISFFCLHVLGYS